jgi:hypothetical protein
MRKWIEEGTKKKRKKKTTQRRTVRKVGAEKESRFLAALGMTVYWYRQVEL